MKTSTRITYTFLAYHFLSLFLLLLVINVTYFFIWYQEQKQASLHDMDMKYSLFSMPNSDMEVEEFTSYLLEKDTLIIPENGESVCSPSLEKKIHADISIIQNSYFYKYDGKIYFVFSQHYDKIGDVKVLFDTTPYIKSQIIIIKISIVAIICFLLLAYFIGNIVAKKAFFGLKKIVQEIEEVDIHNTKTLFVPKAGPDDEIKILALATNKMLEKIHSQTDTLKQFITDVSHECKTPLMALTSHLDVIEKKDSLKKFSQNNYTQSIYYIRQQIQKLNTLLETLFYLARSEQGIGMSKKQKISAKEILERVWEDMQIYNKNNIVLNIHPEKKNFEYMIAPDLFKIVLENLLSNALKFSGDSKKIDVFLNKNYIEVQDYGVGISQKNIENIWNKFFKADTNISGFGVGLFIVKRICEVNGWKIEVQSKVSQGTKFTLFVT